MAFNTKTFITRTLTAIVFVAVLLGGIMYNYWSFALLFLVVSVWGLYEFYQLAEKLGAKPYKAIGLIAGGFLYTEHALASLISYEFEVSSNLLMSLCFVFLFIIFLVALFDERPNTILNTAYTFLGIIYAVIPFIILINISNFVSSKEVYGLVEYTAINAGFNPHYVLGIILLIWLNDSAAYLVGSFIGKNKLYERISPGKTWEGTIGAAVITMACSYIISLWFQELAFIHWLVIALIVAVLGTAGDLVESMLKRQASVKDSGKIMPGHGGILDRFDSLLFVSPFIYAYLQLFCR